MASTAAERSRTRSRRFLPSSGAVVEPYRLTPRLALRIAVLGVVMLIVFAALFLRLWALQVLAGTKYVDQARANSYRTVAVQAPRGLILDRNGAPLVTNHAATAIELWPADLPKVYVDRFRELSRISQVARVPLYEIAREIKRQRGDPVAPVIVRDAASAVTGLKVEPGG